MKRVAIFTVLLLGMPLVASVTAGAAQLPCNGSSDEFALASLLVPVSPAKRGDFVRRIKAYNRERVYVMEDDHVGSEYGLEILYIAPKTARGILIVVSDQHHPNIFAFHIETCNATENWRPHWNLFQDFIRSLRAQGYR